MGVAEYSSCVMWVYTGEDMNLLGPSFFKFLFGFVGILALGFVSFFVANYYDSKDAVSINAAAVEFAE